MPSPFSITINPSMFSIWLMKASPIATCASVCPKTWERHFGPSHSQSRNITFRGYQYKKSMFFEVIPDVALIIFNVMRRLLELKFLDVAGN